VNPQSRTVAGVLIALVAVLSSAAALAFYAGGSTGKPGIFLVASLAILAISLVGAASILVPEFFGAPWIPTSRGLVHEILSLSEVRPGEVLYDLGSGDGRIVLEAAREYGAIAIGVEIDPFRVLYSRTRIARLGIGNRAKILRGNFFDVDLGDADVVVLYLLQSTNDRIQSKLERELRKPGCRVVSVVWEFKGWDLIRKDEKGVVRVYTPMR
jgi:SAM-dependent methyltransferase